MNIVLVGAGPRGLILLERLVSYAKFRQKEIDKVSITLIDPTTIGGRVWDPFLLKNHEYIMNTVTSQISFFTDDSIQNVGPIHPGPTFFEWTKNDGEDYIKNHPQFDQDYLQELRFGENDFPTRGLLGIYAHWFFDQIVQQTKNTNISIQFIKDTIIDIRESGNQYIVLGKGNEFDADEVVMALGHPLVNQPNEEENNFQKLADENDDITYISQGHPSEVDLSSIKAGEEVVVRGLGLSFYDYITELTQGRGGKIEVNGDEFIYHPSGQEPKVIAGSRHGLPLHARGNNQKTPSELYKPYFFTVPNLEKMRDEKGHISFNDFFELFSQEIQWKHYNTVVNDEEIGSKIIDKETFLLDLKNNSSRVYADLAKQFRVPEEYVWDWDKLLNSQHQVPENQDYQQWFMDYLQRDIHYARKGNKNAPYTGAFDILRDIRDTVRYVVESKWFLPDDYSQFLKDFTLINVLLSVGPPRHRIKELLAYMKAGVLTIVGPGLTTKIENNQFVTTSERKDERYITNTLVEARLNSANFNQLIEPLQKNLKDKKWIRNFTLLDEPSKQSLSLGAIEIDPETFEIINIDGNRKTHLRSFGIPQEGEKWFATVIPRGGVNTVITREADHIANLITK